MTTPEPQLGDRVRFRTTHGHSLGVVVNIITAGKAAGRGVWRLRQRARIQFESRGRRWETHRDFDDISIVTPQEQGDLFDDERPSSSLVGVP